MGGIIDNIMESYEVPAAIKLYMIDIHLRLC